MADTLRSCIISHSGYTFISLDASQIELKVLAYLSQDPQMIADVESGDMHAGTARRMFGYPTTEEARDKWLETNEEEPTEEQINQTIKEIFKKRRYDAKQCNFATVYGADERKLSEMFECSLEEASRFMTEHRNSYPRMYQWMDEKIAEARANGYVMTMFGRIRPIPDINSGIFKLRRKAERIVVNTIVQSTAIDIVKMAMIFMRNIYPIETIRLVLNVHDEMLWEVPDHLLAWAIEQTEQLKQAFPQYPFSMKVGKVYGEMEDYPAK